MLVYVRGVDYVELGDRVVCRIKWVALKVAVATGAALRERIQLKLDWRVAQLLLAPDGLLVIWWNSPTGARVLEWNEALHHEMDICCSYGPTRPRECGAERAQDRAGVGDIDSDDTCG